MKFFSERLFSFKVNRTLINCLEKRGYTMKKRNSSILIGVSLICWIIFLPITRGLTEELQYAPPQPPIEELTAGKVKVGDVITKDNVDLVKDYLSPGVYANVKNGMVMRIGTSVPPEKLLPKYYLELTERYKGKAVIDDHGVVTLQDGAPWPGGIPFTEPKTGMEAMAYTRFGHAYDDAGGLTQGMYYVNKEGKCYKSGVMNVSMCYCQARTKMPPLGIVPGMEDILQRMLGVFVYPLELKGMGQLQIKHVDDAAKYDVGFAYLPAFKRTIRISATTYQDNLGGGDATYGDVEGLREPYSSWNFKLIGTKYMLVAEQIRPGEITLDATGTKTDLHLDYDLGVKYPRLGWAINKICIVEGTPKDPGHIYSKKVFYNDYPLYNSCFGPETVVVDIYDRAGQLWKLYLDRKGYNFRSSTGESFTGSDGFVTFDLQSGHSTHAAVHFPCLNCGFAPESLSLSSLLRLGR